MTLPRQFHREVPSKRKKKLAAEFEAVAFPRFHCFPMLCFAMAKKALGARCFFIIKPAEERVRCPRLPLRDGNISAPLFVEEPCDSNRGRYSDTGESDEEDEGPRSRRFIFVLFVAGRLLYFKVVDDACEGAVGVHAVVKDLEMLARVEV